MDKELRSRTNQAYIQSKEEFLDSSDLDVQSVVKIIEASADASLSKAQNEATAARVALTGISAGYAWIPLLGDSLCEINNEAKALIKVDESSYGRMKTEGVLRVIGECQTQYKEKFGHDLDPEKIHHLLSAAASGLKASDSAHNQLQLEFLKNFGPALEKHISKIDFRLDGIESVLRLEVAGRQKVFEFIKKYAQENNQNLVVMSHLFEDMLHKMDDISKKQIEIRLNFVRDLGGLLSDQRDEFNASFSGIHAFLSLCYSEKQEEKRKEFDQFILNSQYDGVRSGFGLLSSIGSQCGISELSKIGQVGVISVDLFRASNSIISLQSIADAGGALALLSPVSAFGMGIISLASLFESCKQSENVAILKAVRMLAKQVREFRLETGKKLSQIDERLSRFADSMTRHYSMIIDRLIIGERHLQNIIADRFNKVDVAIAELDRRNTAIGQNILFQEARGLIKAIDDKLPSSSFFRDMSISDYHKNRDKLSFWMSDVGNHAVHNGFIYTESSGDSDALALKILDNGDPYQYLSVLFYCLNVHLGVARNIYGLSVPHHLRTDLVNPFLWISVTDAYLKLVMNVSQHFELDEKVRHDSVVEADKVLDAIYSLKTDSRIYFALLSVYQNLLGKAKQILIDQRSALSEHNRINIFGDISSQVNFYSSNTKLPENAVVLENLARVFETNSISLYKFKDLITSHIPKIVFLLCDLGLGSLKVDVSFKDGQIGCYGRHLPHMREKEAKHFKEKNQLVYSIPGFGEIRDYLYYERIFDFSIKFISAENQTKEIHVASISLASLLTRDLKQKGYKFDSHSARSRRPDKIKKQFFCHRKHHGPRYSEKDQLLFSVDSQQKRLISQTLIQLGLNACQDILNRYCLMEEQSFIRVFENKLQNPGNSLDRIMTQLQAIKIIFNAALDVAGVSKENAAIRQSVSLFFHEVPRWKSFQEEPHVQAKSIMHDVDSILSVPLQAMSDFKNELLKEREYSSPLEIALNERIQSLVVLPRMFSGV